MLSRSLHQARHDLTSHRRWLVAFQKSLHRGQNCLVDHQWPPTQHHGRTYATKKTHGRKPTYSRRPLEGSAAPTPNQRLYDHILGHELGAASQLYASTSPRDKIGPTTVGSLCKLLVSSLERTAFPSPERERMRELAHLIVKDLKSGVFGPQPFVAKQLMNGLRLLQNEAETTSYWQWLEAQPDECLDLNTYGPVLEMLAEQGKSKQEIEETYQRALSRYPGTFLEYHLSPNAMVSDRRRGPSRNHRNVGGFLKGIITARLLKGDTRGAYLGIDTSFRLQPGYADSTILSRVVEERPLEEAYTVFAMLCRAGSPPSHDAFRAFATRLRTAVRYSNLKEHMCAIRAMISATYLYTGANGRITDNYVNEIIIAITGLARIPSVRALDAPEAQKVADGALELVRRVLEVFANFGTKPGISAFNSIITNIAGYGKSKSTVTTALKDIATLGLKPNFVTLRSCLTAAGLLRDEELIRTTWSELVQARTAANQRPDVTDLHVFIKATRLTGLQDLAETEVDIWKHNLPEKGQEDIKEHLERDYTQAEDEGATRNETDQGDMLHEKAPAADAEDVLFEMDKIAADLATFEEITDFNTRVQDFRGKPLPMTLLAPPSPPMPEPELKRLYDEYTVETQHPDKSQPQPQGEPAYSTTNIPYDDLRYENWKTINFLLRKSKTYDDRFYQRVDECIESGKQPPKRSMDYPRVKDGLRSYGLSNAVKEPTEPCIGMTEDDVERARRDLILLRGPIGGATE